MKLLGFALLTQAVAVSKRQQFIWRGNRRSGEGRLLPHL